MTKKWNPRKARHDIYLSDEGEGSNDYVIKGNNLTCKWVGNAIVVWSQNNEEPVLQKEQLDSIENSIKSFQKSHSDSIQKLSDRMLVIERFSSFQ